MTLPISKKINAEIDACSRCLISQLQFNIKDSRMGYGKLYGWRGSHDIEFFFIGMNPSHRRWPGIQYALGGDNFDNGIGAGFVKILDVLKIKERSAIDNLCHCSTESNSISAYNALNCFPFLLREIELFNPLKIIAMGNRTFDLVEQLIEINDHGLSSKLTKIRHPSFILNYRRGLIGEFIMEIKQVCELK